MHSYWTLLLRNKHLRTSGMKFIVENIIKYSDLKKHTIEEQKADIQKRYKLENDRYFNLYNVHKDDLSNYDFVIDTTNLTPKEAANKIKEEYHKWLKK